VSDCCWRDRLSVGNSLRIVTVGAGTGFFMAGAVRGLKSDSIAWRS
jgi:hypothetical protein